MENAGSVLSATMLAVGFISLVTGSYKSGLMAFSGQSLFKKSHSRFKINKTRIQAFVISIFIVLIISAIFALIITRGDLLAALIFGSFNTAFASYALIYWILLTDKE